MGGRSWATNPRPDRGNFFRATCLRVARVASPRDGGRIDGFQIRARPGTLMPVGPTNLGGEAPEQGR
jgi:hypothetical protein